MEDDGTAPLKMWYRRSFRHNYIRSIVLIHERAKGKVINRSVSNKVK